MMDERKERLRMILCDNIPLTPYAVPDIMDKILALLPQWISVATRLPEEEGIYLTALEDTESMRTMFFSMREGGLWESPYRCTHWTSLPQPPKEG